MPERDLRAAVAAVALAVDTAQRDLLQSVVASARAHFGGRAASVFELDEPAGEIVFAAVSGEGEGTLEGRRFRAGTGIAGFTLASRQPLIIDDVTADPRFSHEAAESTGYMPTALVSAPLLRGDDVIGVIQILDRQPGRFGLREMEILGHLATQAAAALEVLRRARRARAVLDDGDDRLRLVARLAEAVDRTTGRGADTADRLLEALGDLLRSGR